MTRPTDISVDGASLYLLPVRTRVPLKFGKEVLTEVTCARACVEVRDRAGRRARGWGETPLSVQWVWPSSLSYDKRHKVMREFSVDLAKAWAGFNCSGHALEVSFDFQGQVLPRLLAEFNGKRPGAEPMPWLAALVCCSPFDLALHDAYGQLAGRPVYDTYGPDFLSRDLADFIEPAGNSGIQFRGQFPRDYLIPTPPKSLLAWHLVGGLDPLEPGELTGSEPEDGQPVLLTDWIRRDGLQCLKIKLRGNDAAWDYARLVVVGQIAASHEVRHLSADFNCTVTDPEYVNDILDRLHRERPAIFDALLYVEQPFPYDLEANQIDVHAVSVRKPLFMDESAHDWKLVRLGRELGWNGVALKTCKTQTGAILTACWAKAHAMSLMVQDLTNPMLAQIPHVLLAANVGTIAGVETNSMQFYPQASRPEGAVHVGLYQRRGGHVDFGSVRGPGFGYRIDEIARELPAPAVSIGM